MTSDLERSKKYLRSILLATKGGVPEAQLVKRYREQTGENIPFRRFNCSSLQAFLQSVPDVCRVTVRGGAVVVEGVATAETKHIKEMVKMQGLHPAARTRGNGGGGGGARGKCFQSKPLPSFSSNHHVAQSSGGKWQSPGQRSSPAQAAVHSPRGASGSPASSARAYSNNANIVLQPFPKPAKKSDLPPENQMKTNPKYLRGQIKSIHTTPPPVTRSAGSQNNNVPRNYKEPNDQVSRPSPTNVTSSLSVTIPNQNVMNGGTGQVKSLPLPSVPNGGEYYDLRVSHVVSAAEIYVQSYVSLQRYYTMGLEMARFYGGDEELGLAGVGPGMFVAVRRGEAAWSRAKVVAEVVPLHGGRGADTRQFLVTLVDTGASIIAKMEDIRELAIQFGQYPVQVLYRLLFIINHTISELYFKLKAIKMKLSGLTQCGEAAAVWLRHVCLDQCFVGYVEARRSNEVDITLFDTTLKDLDIVINDEMIKLGFATKEVTV